MGTNTLETGHPKGTAMTIYAIGDIHGQNGMLEDALARIDADGGAESEVIFLGDYVDRGPGNRAVLDLLSKGLAQGRNWTCLRGNHDQMFLDFVTKGTVDFPQIKSGKAWVHPDLGGLSTLRDYGIALPELPDWPGVARALRAAMPPDHLGFLQGLAPYAERDGLLFVHAGIRPGTALADQDPNDLMWIRQPFLTATAAHPWLVVHGHTAVKAPEHHGNRVNLDSGAGFGRPLSTAVFEGGEVCVLTDKGRQKLAPARVS